ncbi:cannabidiolic acid synthase-like [Melia azedarach]|uniref:Cannabidiolic acid synthase-like n=1 Tax=Melia azedarach TaxID=155640 RepID=A0ACC1WX36_MELAZ|nr:cannabidiolic acid synthase-like [Melia azedarach]
MIIHKWQYIADKLPKDLLIGVGLQRRTEGNREFIASFGSLFLGGVDSLLPLVQKFLPELGLTKEDCREYFRTKSDYVKQPIPETALEEIYDRFSEEEGNTALLTMIPYGGKMSEISESETPFPHRAGNIYKMMYEASWSQEENEASQRYFDWIRRLYSFMTPYVSKNPREAYLNYRDLDIGTNNEGFTSIEQASIWGKKYFKNNFNRLVGVKTLVDAGNFFRHEQSIPPVSAWRKNKGDWTHGHYPY